MTRDTGRRSVYVAEDAAFEGTPLVRSPGTEVLARALATLFESPWWRAHDIEVPAVRFRAGRNDGFVRPPPEISDRDRSSRQPSLLGLGSEAPWYVASHEIAHLVSRSDDKVHGAAFRAGHIAVAAAVYGDDCAHALRHSYGRFGLDLASLVATTVLPPTPPIWESMIAWAPSRGGWRPERRTAHGSDSPTG